MFFVLCALAHLFDFFLSVFSLYHTFLSSLRAFSQAKGHMNVSFIYIVRPISKQYMLRDSW